MIYLKQGSNGQQQRLGGLVAEVGVHFLVLWIEKPRPEEEPGGCAGAEDEPELTAVQKNHAVACHFSGSQPQE